MSSLSIYLCTIILILYQHCHSQSFCYELASSECHPIQTKQCSMWNNDIVNQCICIMNTLPMDVYFLLDATNIDIHIWQHILLSIPLSFLHKCSSNNTNNYVVQYTNNQTNVLSKPSISQLSTFKPIENGTYSSFCNALNVVQNHIMSSNSNNAILLVVITGNKPDDVNLNNQCHIELLPQLQDIYSVYLNDIQSDIYEPILSYHQAFQISSISEIEIINNLITATICEYTCDISSNAHNQMSPSPTTRPTYFKSWGRAWYVGRWEHDKKEYDRNAKKRYKHHMHMSSAYYGYNGFGWNRRYKSHKSHKSHS